MTTTKEKKHNTSILWYGLGVELEESGKFEEAIESYDKAIELDPNDTDTWCSRGNALASLQLFQEAIKSYNRAIEIDPGNQWALNNKAHTLYQIGNALRQKGETKEANLYFQKARNILNT